MDLEIKIGRKEIKTAQEKLSAIVWPEYILRDKYTLRYWDNLYTHFSHCQFALYSDNQLLGVGNAVPLNFEGDYNDLSDLGYDWALQKASEDLANKLQPNLLVGLQILISPDVQSKGLSYKFVDAMKEIAQANGYKGVALPVRPTQKYKHPQTPLKEYVTWTNEQGKVYDPWIRVHANAGGKILNVCNRSMDISGSVSDWEKWSGLKFANSGDYIVDKALCPVRIDLENNLGEYLEPNVWVVYEIQSELENEIANPF